MIRTLGLMTYPLYLLHFTIGIFGMALLVKQGMEQIEALCITMLILLLLSWIVCAQIEPPLRRKLADVLTKIEHMQRQRIREAS